jgi:hypothetical protein
LSNRVAFPILDIRHIFVFLAEINESGGIRNLLASSSFLDEVDDILLHFTILKRQTNLFAGLKRH